MMRSQQALASAGEAVFCTAAPLRSDLCRSRRSHDLLRGDALRYRSDDTVMVPRCRSARATLLSLSEQPELLGFAVVGVITVVSLGVGEFARTGWLYTPLSGIEYGQRRGRLLDMGVATLGDGGTTLTGINFFVTILKMRAPGMTMFKMPVFCTKTLCAPTY